MKILENLISVKHFNENVCNYHIPNGDLHNGAYSSCSCLDQVKCTDFCILFLN